ncbi:MAG: hypothetical protein IID41_12200 [Planctomycetes bacterium]|nr:hypothetical protein [Planctomycetota bacterium]
MAEQKAVYAVQCNYTPGDPETWKSVYYTNRLAVARQQKKARAELPEPAPACYRIVEFRQRRVVR